MPTHIKSLKKSHVQYTATYCNTPQHTATHNPINNTYKEPQEELRGVKTKIWRRFESVPPYEEVVLHI